MGLATAQLATDLLALYTSARAGSGLSDTSFANSMASLLTDFVQSGAVSTVVTGVEPGAGTANGTGTIA